MARKVTKTSGEKRATKHSRPALTPEARENQLISLAVDEAERQLREGTASSQVVVHFLKLASSRDRLEREKLEQENELLKAKTEAFRSAKKTEELIENALAAMRTYTGNGGSDDH